jgi:acetyl-CoA carboxylase biotin carboxyl carrier protein
MANEHRLTDADPVLAALAALLPELEAHGVVELEVTIGDSHLYLRQRPGQLLVPHISRSTKVDDAPAAEEGLVAITTPLLGTFYGSPAPDEPPYVRVGDKVEAGQVVALIEAMKVFNEIHAEVAGTVTAVLATTGQLVQSAQVLMYLRPATSLSADDA